MMRGAVDRRGTLGLELQVHRPSNSPVSPTQRALYDPQERPPIPINDVYIKRRARRGALALEAQVMLFMV